MSEKQDSQPSSIDETPATETVVENEPDKIESVQAQSEPVIATSKEPIVVKKSSNLVAYLALLLSLVSIGALGAAYWFWQQMQTEQLQQQTAQEQSLAQWQGQQSSQFQTLEQTLVKQLAEQQSKLIAEQSHSNQVANEQLSNNVNSKLSDMQKRITEVNGREPNDWVLAEAEYLIRIGGRKLWVEHDKNTAKNLLAQAFVRIKSLADPSLSELESTILSDINTIDGLYEPKTYDYYQSLSSVIDQIDHYPINMVKTIKEELPAQTEAATVEPVEAPSWWDNFVKNISPLKNMVYVNPGVADADIQRVLMPEQQWFLRTNVKMALMHAQLALLKRNDPLFRDSVERAKIGLGKFNQADSAVIAGMQILSHNLNEPVDAKYPDKLPSHSVLNRVLRARMGEAAIGIAEPANIPATEQPKPVDNTEVVEGGQ